MKGLILLSGCVLCFFAGIVNAHAQANYEPYLFGTFAGKPAFGSADGHGADAQFYQPDGAALDSDGNIYVADTGNQTIRKITPDGTASTYAGVVGGHGSNDGPSATARFNGPGSVAVDSAGNIYVADTFNHTIRKIDTAGNVTTFAGLAGSIGSTNGTGNAARFFTPRGVAVDSADNVYVADTGNNTIRKITPAGVVTTFAGLALNSGFADGTGSVARFTSPAGLAVDGSGNVFVADTSNQTIRKITPGAVVTTFAGLAGNLGSADGTGSDARFNFPNAVAIDSSGNVYVADDDNDTVRKITPGAVVTTFAGLAGNSGSADGTGSAARFAKPLGVAVDSTGNVYVADYGNNTIRAITPDAVVTTLAGSPDSGAPGGDVDGTGSAARFLKPLGAAVDSSGNVYVGDNGNNKIRKITPDGVVTGFAGSGMPGNADGPGDTAQFNSPEGVAVDGAGNVYVADTDNYTIRKITPDRTVSTLAGSPGSSAYVDGTGSAARFVQPTSITVDSTGDNIYVADSAADTIRHITADGVVTTVAGSSGSSGSADGIGAAARFYDPEGLAVDSEGNVYVADTFNNTIRKITPDGTVTTLAGLAGTTGGDDGIGSAARFTDPEGVAVDSAGNVYVAGTKYSSLYANDTVRKITPAAVVTTLAGVWNTYGSTDGVGSTVRFYLPDGIAVDNAGNIYVADNGSNTIRVGTAANAPQSLNIAPLASNHMLLTGHAFPNSTVTISATTDLTSTFMTIGTVNANVVGVFRYEDTDANSFLMRFYQASFPSGMAAKTGRRNWARTSRTK